MESLGSFGMCASTGSGRVKSTTVKRSWRRCSLQFVDVSSLDLPMLKKFGFGRWYLMSSLVAFGIEALLLYLHGK